MLSDLSNLCRGGWRSDNIMTRLSEVCPVGAHPHLLHVPMTMSSRLVREEVLATVAISSKQA